MSDNKISIGFMAELTQPIGDHNTEAWQELTERLETTNSGLELNYDGTLVFSKETDDYAYQVDMVVVPRGGDSRLIELCNAAKLDIDGGGAKAYSCHWHNGSDSPMSTMTLAEFYAGV